LTHAQTLLVRPFECSTYISCFYADLYIKKKKKGKQHFIINHYSPNKLLHPVK